MALTLPLELQQQIFDHLDPHSFYATRKVCRSWNYASRDSVTLARQLRQLPIEPHVYAEDLCSQKLQQLYNQAAQALSLGMNVIPQNHDIDCLAASMPEEKTTISSDGCRALSLESRTITLYDVTGLERSIISQRVINDLRSPFGHGPWFKCASPSMHELTLSSDGSMLAIALERTIQIYDLDAGPTSWPVSAYIPSAAGHYIVGLQFEHNNSLLRVQLSKKGTVLYLGTPRDSSSELSHWSSAGGLKHVYADSSKLAVMPLASHGILEKLSGLQLLRTLGSGWLFAAQKQQGTCTESTYCIGYIASIEDDERNAIADKTATMLLEMPSSAYSLPESVMDNWRKLPSANARYPRFALSLDGTLLALSDNAVTGNVNENGNSIFVYGIPSMEQLQAVFNAEKDYADSFDSSSAEGKQQYYIHRLPHFVGDVRGTMLQFDIHSHDQDAAPSYSISATTTNASKSWTLLQC